jgi:hypothetical protein
LVPDREGRAASNSDSTEIFMNLGIPDFQSSNQRYLDLSVEIWQSWQRTSVRNCGMETNRIKEIGV